MSQSRIPPSLRLALLASLLPLLASSTAAGSEPAPRAIEDAAPPADSLPAKRPVPDYDGRGPATTTTGEDLLWIPRIAVAPLYLASEYLVRRPVGAVLIAVEKYKVAQTLTGLFTFGAQKNLGFFPTFFYEFNLLPSVGVYFWWDEALVRENHVRVHFATWGLDWLKASVTDRYDLGARSTVALRAAFSRRQDHLFFGLGPDSTDSFKSRYQATVLDVGPAFELQATRGVHVTTAAAIRATSFGEGTCCSDPTLQERVRAGEVPAPPRLADGFAIAHDDLAVAFDTGGRRSESQTRLRLDLHGAPAFDVSRRAGSSWLNYGATAGAFWDVTGSARVLSVSLATLFADPLQGSGADIPFTELVSLGGAGLMRGFLPGRLIGRSAAVATLAYQWPVWAFLDGTMQVSTGNVFGAGLRDFDTNKLRLSTGAGLRTNSSPDTQFEVIAGFGTETFAAGAGITSVRLAFGATHGF